MILWVLNYYYFSSFFSFPLCWFFFYFPKVANWTKKSLIHTKNVRPFVFLLGSIPPFPRNCSMKSVTRVQVGWPSIQCDRNTSTHWRSWGGHAPYWLKSQKKSLRRFTVIFLQPTPAINSTSKFSPNVCTRSLILNSKNVNTPSHTLPFHISQITGPTCDVANTTNRV